MGAFILHASAPNEGFRPFDENEIAELSLERIEISGKDCQNIRKSLSNFGIWEASLFPDLGGLCNGLASVFKDIVKNGGIRTYPFKMEHPKKA